MAECRAAFYLFFRRVFFKGDWVFICGLELVMEYFDGFGFDDSDIEYFCILTGNDGELLFVEGFFEYFRGLKFICDVDVMVEGELVYDNESLIRVIGLVL